MRKVLFLTVLLSSFTACGGASIEGLRTPDILDWERLEPFADSVSVESAREKGVIRRYSESQVQVGKFNLFALSMEVQGEFRDFQLFCEVFGSVGERRLDPKALLAVPSNGAETEAALSALGLSRAEIFLLDPQNKTVIYSCAKDPQLALVYRRSAQDSPELVAIARSSPGIALDSLFPKSLRWSSVEKRLSRAIATGATLDQLRVEVSYARSIPFREDRERAMELFKSFTAEIEKRAQELRAAWPKAELEERCLLVRQAQDLAKAAADVDGLETAALAQELQAEILTQLDGRIKEAEAQSLGFTKAAWLIARARILGNDPRPLARPVLNPLAATLIPVISSSAPRSLDELYRPEKVLQHSMLLAKFGAPIESRQSLVARAPKSGTLNISLIQDNLSAQTQTIVIPHNYTIPNPAFAIWVRDVNEASTQLQGAQSGVKATADYDTVIEKKTIYMDRDGSNKRESIIHETVRNQAKYLAHQQALADVQRWTIRLNQLQASRPPERLDRQTTYNEERQIWSGQAQRTLQLSIDGQSYSIPQTFKTPTYKVRTPGWQGSDLAHENRPATDNWTERTKLLDIARQGFNDELGAALLPTLESRLRARLEAWLAAKPAAAKSEESRWASFFLDLSLSREDAARCAQAIPLEP